MLKSESLFVGFRVSFQRRLRQCFTRETAVSLCVPPKLVGDSYRESICQSLWLQSGPAECSRCRTADNLTFQRPASRPLLLPLDPLQTLQSCRAGALWGLRSNQTHLSVNACSKTRTDRRNRKLYVSHLSHNLDLRAGWTKHQESVCWMKAWRPLRTNEDSVCW